jgi:hypothetical protein
MNKFFFLLSFLPFIGKSQIVDYFAHQPRWTVRAICAVPHPCINTENKEYFLGADTLIAGNIYKGIYKMGHGSFQYFSPPPGPQNCTGTYSYVNDTVADAFLRQDGKKLLIWNNTMQMEELLYDFDLNVGDTVPNSHINYLGSVDTVVSVDSILIHGQFRRVIHTQEGIELIEGVGSNFGFLEPMDVIFDCGYQRICYSLSDTSWLPVPGNNCNLLVGDSFQSDLNQEIVCSQSGQGGWRIEIPNRIPSCKFSLVDMSGKMIFSGILNTGINDLQPSSELCVGIYILQISTREFVDTRKVQILK